MGPVAVLHAPERTVSTRRFVAVLTFVACAQGCAAPAASGDPTTAADDAGTTSSSGETGGTTFVSPVACETTEDCAAGGFCVAPFDAGAPTVALGRGDPVCIDECVGALALDRWCMDDAACCDGLTCDALDGLCRDAASDSSSSGATTWATVDGSSGDGDSSGETASSSDGTTEGSTSGG